MSFLEEDRAIVEGFEDPGVGGFAGHIGPIYRKQIGTSSIAGFRVEDRHCDRSAWR
jgi:catabolite regulation protein CreA